MPTIAKLVYEFWGFCVNGGNSLTLPGGFATSQTSGSYLNMPVGFESGSTALLASGSDGVTMVGNPFFNVTGSSPFSPAMVGKHLVMWKSGSTSTDDSIYKITRWFNSSSISVDPTTGGTVPQPNLSGSYPTFTGRTGINYRVVEIGTPLVNLGFAGGMYMVLQFNNAAAINPGQANSQVMLAFGSGSNNNFDNLALVLSPSGSWNGSSFTSESYPGITGEGSNSGPGGGGGSGLVFMNESGRGNVSLWGGTGFLICAVGGIDWTGQYPGNGSYFQLEVPQRLYPQSNDPNPITAVYCNYIGLNINGQTGYSSSMRWFPSPYDTVLRRWGIAVRCFSGGTWHSSDWGSAMQNGNGNRYNLQYNPVTKKFIMTDGILCQVGTASQTPVDPRISSGGSPVGQYSMARARLRTVRYCAGYYPQGMKVGDNNDQWVHVGGGIMWPWDGACLPRSLQKGL